MTFSATPISTSSFISCACLLRNVKITALASALDLDCFITGIGVDLSLLAIAHYLVRSLFAAIFRCLTARSSAVFACFVSIYLNSFI